MKQSRGDHASLGIAALTFADKTRAIDSCTPECINIFQNFVVRIFREITISLFSSKAILYNKALTLKSPN